ncbi:MAG TPA: tetratricopeptide repeat protein, partial [Elusimicrobiales bacterium]|nr:tetratricopeptide repeat protein [Elusimicrobiales bacterium]
NQKAINDFNTLLAKYPRNTYIVYRRGTAYMAMRQYKEAIEDFTLAIKYKNGNYPAYTERGLAYMYLNEWDLAKLDFEKSYTLRGNNPTTNLYLSAYYWAYRKDMDRSLSYLRRALTLGYRDIDALHNVDKVGYFFRGLIAMTRFKNMVKGYR